MTFQEVYREDASYCQWAAMTVEQAETPSSEGLKRFARYIVMSEAKEASEDHNPRSAEPQEEEDWTEADAMSGSENH